MTPKKRNAGLKKADLDPLRKALLKLRTEILGAVTQLESEALRGAEDEISVDHMADHGSDSFEQDQTLVLLERESVTIREINAALKRMEDGTYGVCERTGKNIGKPRLRALPYARLCLEAQMEEEAEGGR